MTSPGSTVSRARSAVLAVSLWRDVWSAAEADCPQGAGRRRPRAAAGCPGHWNSKKGPNRPIGWSGVAVLLRLSAIPGILLSARATVFADRLSLFERVAGEGARF